MNSQLVIHHGPDGAGAGRVEDGLSVSLEVFPDIGFGVGFRRRRRQSNGIWTTRPLASDALRGKCAPLRQCNRAFLLVNLPGDEMPLLIEMILDLGVN